MAEPTKKGELGSAPARRYLGSLYWDAREQALVSYAATLLDSACGCAVHTRLSATQAYTTLELKVAYHKPITRETGPLRAEGRVVSFGRRAAFAEATLVDAEGRLYATATSTLLVIDRP